MFEKQEIEGRYALFTGRDPAGAEVTERVHAATLREALDQLEARGFSEVRFHSEPEVLRPGESAVAPAAARDELRLRRSSTAGVTLRSVLAPLAPIWAPLVLWNGYRIAAGRPSLAGLLILSGFTLWLGYRILPMFLYPAANRDREWHRWRRLGAKVRLLRVLVALRTPAAARPPLEREWDCMNAAVAAGLGRLPEALLLLARHDDGDDLARALNQSRRASILAIAGDVEGVLHAAEAATVLAPDSPLHWIDLALRRLVHRRDAAGAGEALEQARRHPVSDLAWAWMQVAEAMIESEAGTPSAALGKLQRAELELVRAAPPDAAIDGLRALLAAHLCLAHAALGHRTEADREWRRARPFLEATGRDELVARCGAALAAT